MGQGRTREFDEHTALEAAVACFWQRGYSGTSLSQLTDAMGISKPSLYAAFGNKDSLYQLAIAHYAEHYGRPHMAILESAEGALADRVRGFLTSTARMLADPCLPGGCFIAGASAEAAEGALPQAVSECVATMNGNTRAALTAIFQRELESGNSNPDAPVALLADYLLTMQFGLSVLARTGASFSELRAVIELAVDPMVA